MQINILQKLKDDFLEKKTELESKQQNLKIQLEEKTNYIEKLMEEDRYNFDAFSPRKQQKNLKDSILLLEEEKKKLLLELDDLEIQLEYWNEKIFEIDMILQNEMQKIIQSKNDDADFEKDEQYFLSDIIQKLELCHRLSIVDPKRCKIELSLVLNKLQKFVDNM